VAVPGWTLERFSAVVTAALFREELWVTFSWRDAARRAALQNAQTKTPGSNAHGVMKNAQRDKLLFQNSQGITAFADPRCDLGERNRVEFGRRALTSFLQILSDSLTKTTAFTAHHEDL
jgi:hypothetical protein